MITASLNRTLSAVPPAAATPPAAEQAIPTATVGEGKDLHARFSSIASDLEASDATLTTMVAGRNPVGDGWGPHLGSIAERIQLARDALMDARPDETELGARLGRHVLKVAEAAGSMSIMARQRATLSEGWSSFLDASIADARGAAELLAPPATPPATPPGGPTQPSEPAPPAAPAPAGAA